MVFGVYDTASLWPEYIAYRTGHFLLVYTVVNIAFCRYSLQMFELFSFGTLGNKHEQCGDENTIVVYNVIDSRSSYKSSYRTYLDKPNPDFIYDSCIYLHSVNPSTTYQMSFKDTHDIQPRRCLEICTRYHQNYALLNRNKCLCTNIPPKRKKASDSFTSQDFSCTRECPGNYFYTCGNSSNSSVYSMYTMKLHCPASK
jgi:hypothetical protein